MSALCTHSKAREIIHANEIFSKVLPALYRCKDAHLSFDKQNSPADSRFIQYKPFMDRLDFRILHIMHLGLREAHKGDIEPTGDIVTVA